MKIERKSNSQIRKDKEKLIMENFKSVMKKLDATFLIESDINEVSPEKYEELGRDMYHRSDFPEGSISNCCGAKFKMGDICSDCGEHASPHKDVKEAEFVGDVTEDRYQGKMEQIISDLESVKGGLNGGSPTVFVKDNLIHVSGEDGQYFADYYGELSGDGYPTVADSLEQIADKYETYWEWEDAGSVVLFPLD